jgi:hypothetical protein
VGRVKPGKGLHRERARPASVRPAGTAWTADRCPVDGAAWTEEGWRSDGLPVRSHFAEDVDDLHYWDPVAGDPVTLPAGVFVGEAWSPGFPG